MKEKDINELVNIIMIKKFKLPVLYKLEELERIRDEMKKKKTSSTITERFLAPIVPLAPSSTKKDRSGSPVSTPPLSSVKKRVRVATSPKPLRSTEKKNGIVLQQQQKDDSGCISDSGAKKQQAQEHSETFRTAFDTEIKKVETLVKAKFQKLEALKDREILELKKENDNLRDSSVTTTKKLVELRSLIVPLKNQLEVQCTKSKDLEQEKEALVKNSADLQVQNMRLQTEKELSEERSCRDKNRVTTLLEDIDCQKKKTEDLSSENQLLSKSVEEMSHQLLTLKDEHKNELKEMSSLHRSKEEEAKVELQRRDQLLNDVKNESQKKIDELVEKVRSLQALVEAKNHHTEASSSKRRSKDDNPLPRKRRKEPPKPSFETGTALSLVDSFTTALSTGTAGKESRKTAPKLNWSLENRKIVSASQSIVGSSEKGSGIHPNDMATSRLADLFGDDDNKEEDDRGNEAINTTLDQSSQNRFDLSLTYTPAKTSKVLQSSATVLTIRSFKELLKDPKEQKQTVSSVRRVDFEENDEKEDKPFAVKHLLLLKDMISKDVEKCLTKFLENKTISSLKEFRSLGNMLSNYFTEQIEEKHLKASRSTKDISLSNTDKRELIDLVFLFFNIKTWVSNFLQPHAGKLKPNILSNIKENFTQKFFFDIRETKRHRRVTWTDQEYQGHIKTAIDFFMNINYNKHC